MWKSKSSESDPASVPNAPAGDAAATGRLTGTPTGAAAVADPATRTSATAPAPASAPSSTGPRPGATGGTPPPATTAPQDHGPGVVKRTTNNVKRILLLVVGALVALFAVFNSQQVEVHWIFGDAVQSPLILVIAIAFVAGAIIGWLGAKLGGRHASA